MVVNNLIMVVIMKSLNIWLTEYSDMHQDKRNQIIHTIFVPLIMFSILGIFWAISIYLLSLLIIATFIFYLLLSIKYSIIMAIITTIMLLALSVIPNKIDVCLAIFMISWFFQFLGHIYEKKQPAFSKYIQFLLIGPLWLIYKVQKWI